MKDISCRTGEEFWLALASKLCDQDALCVAERYLSRPVDYGNEEESKFRRELRAAMDRKE